MCKIILKYGEELTAAEINGHREPVENGAGLVRYSKHNEAFTLVRDMNHDAMFDKYTRSKHRSPFYLFHSRMPSAGSIIPSNVQPFGSKRMVFCHNGTMDKDKLIWTLTGLGGQFTHQDSDSLLLFKVLNRLPLSSGLALLRTIGQNFVLASSQTKRVYVIGRFSISKRTIGEGDKEMAFLMLAKNDWGEATSYIETDFNGRILQFERSGGNRGYWRQSNGGDCELPN